MSTRQYTLHIIEHFENDETKYIQSCLFNFTDFTNAFDTVHNDIVWMLCMNTSDAVINMIKTYAMHHTA